LPLEAPAHAVGDRSSFNSQVSYIFKHPRKKDLYIALVDRWLPELSGRPDFESGELSETVRSAIRKATTVAGGGSGCECAGPRRRSKDIDLSSRCS
jgi:hypothetical protein